MQLTIAGRMSIILSFLLMYTRLDCLNLELSVWIPTYQHACKTIVTSQYTSRGQQLPHKDQVSGQIYS